MDPQRGQQSAIATNDAARRRAQRRHSLPPVADQHELLRRHDGEDGADGTPLMEAALQSEDKPVHNRHSRRNSCGAMHDTKRQKVVDQTKLQSAIRTTFKMLKVFAAASETANAAATGGRPQNNADSSSRNITHSPKQRVHSRRRSMTFADDEKRSGQQGAKMRSRGATSLSPKRIKRDKNKSPSTRKKHSVQRQIDGATRAAPSVPPFQADLEHDHQRAATSSSSPKQQKLKTRSPTRKVHDDVAAEHNASNREAAQPSGNNNNSVPTSPPSSFSSSSSPSSTIAVAGPKRYPPPPHKSISIERENNARNQVTNGTGSNISSTRTMDRWLLDQLKDSKPKKRTRRSSAILRVGGPHAQRPTRSSSASPSSSKKKRVTFKDDVVFVNEGNRRNSLTTKSNMRLQDPKVDEAYMKFLITATRNIVAASSRLASQQIRALRKQQEAAAAVHRAQQQQQQPIKLVTIPTASTSNTDIDNNTLSNISIHHTHNNNDDDFIDASSSPSKEQWLLREAQLREIKRNKKQQQKKKKLSKQQQQQQPTAPKKKKKQDKQSTNRNNKQHPYSPTTNQHPIIISPGTKRNILRQNNKQPTHDEDGNTVTTTSETFHESFQSFLSTSNHQSDLLLSPLSKLRKDHVRRQQITTIN